MCPGAAPFGGFFYKGTGLGGARLSIPRRRYDAMLLTTFFLSALLQSWLVSGASVVLPRASNPTVTLSKATVVGTVNGSVESYLGIPFAQPP